MNADELIEIADKCYFSGAREKAVEIYKAITQKYKDNIEACLNYSNILKTLGRYENALAELNRGLIIHPCDFKLLCNKGYLLNTLGKFDDALEVLKEAVKYGNDDHHSWNNLGNSYYYTGDLENALKAYNEALSLKPDSSVAKENINNTVRLMKNKV